jgi:hypothetical protein
LYLSVRPPKAGASLTYVATIEGTDKLATATAQAAVTLAKPSTIAATVTRRHLPELIVNGKPRQIGTMAVRGVPALVRLGSTVMIFAVIHQDVYERTLSTTWKKLATGLGLQGCRTTATATLDLPDVVIACLGYGGAQINTPRIAGGAFALSGNDKGLHRYLATAPAVAVLGGKLTYEAGDLRKGLAVDRQGSGWRFYKYDVAFTPGLDAIADTSATVFTNHAHQLGYMFCRLNNCERAAVAGVGFTGTPATYNDGKCQLLWAISTHGSLENGKFCNPKQLPRIKYHVVERHVRDGVSAIRT